MKNLLKYNDGINLEWGVQTGTSTIIGWGCPLVAPLEEFSQSYGAELLRNINFFVPITETTIIFSAWLTAVLFYYPASVAMRWIKAVA